MTNNEIANHNLLCAQLTAEDGIVRLTWEQWGAAFAGPAPTGLMVDSPVAGVDSATRGTIVAVVGDKYDVRYPDVRGTCRYSAINLRPWPLV